MYRSNINRILRSYQHDAVENATRLLKKHQRVIVQAVTGTGKTLIGIALADRYISQGYCCLYIVDRRELLDQTADALLDAGVNVPIGFIAAGYPPFPRAHVQIATMSTLSRRGPMYRPAIIILDEAHHAMAQTWETVLQRYPNVPCVGLTATPKRTDGRTLYPLFTAMYSCPSVQWHIEEQHLSPVQTLSVPEGAVNMDNLVIENGEYSQATLDFCVNKKIIAAAAYAYHAYTPGQQALFFGMNVIHSKLVARQLKERGYKAKHIDAETDPALRERAISHFKEGKIQVLTNCNLFTEGIDAPGCEVVIMGRPTYSTVLFLQQVGRCMRPRPGKIATVLDLVQNYTRHGLADDSREWFLDKSPNQPTQPRVCPRCYTVNRLENKHCFNCEYSFSTDEKQKKQVANVPKETERELVLIRRAIQLEFELWGDGEQAAYQITGRNQ